MELLEKLLKKKKATPATEALQTQVRSSDEHESEKYLFVTIDMNARYLPIDRGEYVEDPLDKIVTELEIGFLDGGGTLVEKGKPVERCDATFFIAFDKIEVFTEIVGKFPPIPKGSFLEYEIPSGKKEAIPIGTAECVSVTFDNTLEEEVYEENDINDLIGAIINQLDENFISFAYWNGQDTTLAFFYCYNFSSAEAVVKELVCANPLGANAVFGRDA